MISQARLGNAEAELRERDEALRQSHAEQQRLADSMEAMQVGAANATGCRSRCDCAFFSFVDTAMCVRLG